MGSKKSKAPDYRGAAEESGRWALEAAQWEAAANRPGQITPYGEQRWYGTPGQPGYGTEIILSPQEQQAFDLQQQMKIDRSALGQGLMGRVGQEIMQPRGVLPEAGGTPNVPNFYGQGLPDMGRYPLDPGMVGRGQLPAGQGPGVQGREQFDTGAAYDPQFADTAFQRQMSLVGPMHEQATEALDVQLRNQGLVPGTEAYDRGVENLRNQQGEEVNRLSADAVDRGRQEPPAQFLREYEQANFGMGAGQQRFGQEQSLAQFLEQQRAARMGEQGAGFNAQLEAAQFADRQRGQLAQEQMGFGQLGFGQQMQQAEFQNQLRQAARAEGQQDPLMALNMMNALLTQQQVGMPQMPGFSNVSRPQTPDFLGAANMQGQFDLQNQQNAMAPWNALGGIGAAYLGRPGQ